VVLVSVLLVVMLVAVLLVLLVSVLLVVMLVAVLLVLHNKGSCQRARFHVSGLVSG
jgi:hypothetical protein